MALCEHAASILPIQCGLCSAALLTCKDAGTDHHPGRHGAAVARPVQSHLPLARERREGRITVDSVSTGPLLTLKMKQISYRSVEVLRASPMKSFWVSLVASQRRAHVLLTCCLSGSAPLPPGRLAWAVHLRPPGTVCVSWATLRSAFQLPPHLACCRSEFTFLLPGFLTFSLATAPHPAVLCNSLYSLPSPNPGGWPLKEALAASATRTQPHGWDPYGPRHLHSS